MATFLPNPPILTSENDPFSDVEQKINLKFNELIEAVVRRREQLLTELSALREQFKDSNLEIVHEIDELETLKSELTQSYNEMGADVENLELENSIHKMEQQINDLKRKLSQSVEVELSCDTQKLEQDMAGLGKICVKRVDKVVERDYSLIKSPLFKAGKSGSKEEELKNPGGLCIDNSTDLVYIADRENNRIQVWTLNGDYVSTFGEELLKYPNRLIVLNGVLFVTDYLQDCIFKFNLSNLSLLARSEIKIEQACAICSELKKVFALSINRIVIVLSTDLSYVRMFKGCIKECYDIRINNSILYALEVDMNQITLIDSNTGHLTKVIIIMDGAGLNFACYLCLDQSGNFLITDWKSNQIKIITGDGTLLRLINTSEWELKEPTGIEVSGSGKVALVFGEGYFCQI